MGRIYKQIIGVRLTKVWLNQEQPTHEIEIRDSEFIEKFRRLAEDAPRSECYHGNLETPRYFVTIIGHNHIAKGEVQPRYALFKNERLYFHNKALWNLIEEYAAPLDS